MELEHVSQCDSCSAVVRVHADHVGCRCRCPSCGDSILVTSAKAVDDTDVEISGTFELVKAADQGGSQGSSVVSGDDLELTDADAPKSLGRFLLKRKLGQGGFGEVWLADEQNLKRKLAIKLPRFKRSDLKRRRRFIAEAKAAASLRHPNIVPIIDADEIDGQDYIASEYIRGKVLSEYENCGENYVVWCIEIIEKLASALHYAHSRAIVHRDIKPDNVLIDDRGEPQLLDFGLAKNLDDDGSQTIDGTVMGTPAYMSPEQARGETQSIGPASDQYSLGVVMYALIAGKTPFSGSSIAILKRVASDGTPSLADACPKVSKDVAAICDKARAFDIRDRYKSCEELARDCDAFLAGRAISARPIGVVEKVARWGRRNRRDAILAACCAILGPLLFAASVAGWWNAQRLTSAAAQSEARVRRETTRLLNLKTRLDQSVNEAQQARDTALKVLEDEEEARKKLELETAALLRERSEVIRTATESTQEKRRRDEELAMNASSTSALDKQMESLSTTEYRRQKASEDLDSQEPELGPKNKTDQDKLDSLLSELETVVVPSHPDDEKLVSCYWFGELIQLRKTRDTRVVISKTAGARYAVFRDNRSATPLDISLTSGGRFICFYSMSSGYGIGNLVAPNVLVPLLDGLMQKAGRSIYSNYGVAYSPNEQSFFFVFEDRVPPNEKIGKIVKFDPGTKVQSVARVVPFGRVDIFPFDAASLFLLTDGRQVLQFAVEGIETSSPKIAWKLGLHKELVGRAKEITEVDFLTEDLAVVRFYNTAYLLDRVEKTWSKLNKPVVTSAAYTSSGQGVVLNYQGPQSIKIPIPRR